MAAKLQCEICGGKLVGKPDGVFECDSCGTEYSTEWAKTKIQEITGTVKVEGTVEVQGSVKVEGTANKESLLKRGNMALEDREWDKAEEFFDAVLNMNAECAGAYLGQAMAKWKCHNWKAFAGLYVRPDAELCRDKYAERARKFGDDEMRAWFDGLDAERCVRQRREAAERADRQRKRDNRLLLIASAQHMIAAGGAHTVGLKADGTVVAVGSRREYQCSTGSWKDVVAIAAGSEHTVGLRLDGTVIAQGEYKQDQCKVGGWTNIVAIAAGVYHTVGLKADGTVVAVGRNDDGQCDVGDWKNIVAIAAGREHTVGLKSDGTVVAVGENENGQCVVGGWTDIVAVAAGSYHTVGLKSDGTVVAVGSKHYYHYCGQCNVDDWADIVAIAAGSYHTVGLKADGTVVAVGDYKYGQHYVNGWTDIVAVAAGGAHTVGLKSDGTVIAVGSNGDGQCDVSDWKLFNNVDTIEQERVDAMTDELANLKGLFTAKRRKSIETWLAKI